ncbi:YoaK family protein [Niabella ginsengisoli]|uniref:DUF1275 domain-containing protein n=1 Tax=Niabella ginsengisoli TaxID=522298 RepID=A0ABS9SMD5_9BACT|nr:YoaK family protein [Niabella ginsengisoli]MCH5599551.1 DUF1275 domain-containing protein [Niabella ginsengisoli]
MLRKYSNSRSLGDNVKLGILTALVAGMVNVASLLLFLSFSSNVTGYFAIFASELANGDLYQIALVGSWIFLYFFGCFVSNFIVINLSDKNKYLAHAIPLLLELSCLLAVGVYGDYWYNGTLQESEIMLSFLLFAMGLQNGLTASISNFAVKTTHLTGATTDLGILAAMFTSKKFRRKKEMRDKATLIASIAISYVTGGVLFALFYKTLHFKMFYIIGAFLLVVILYDSYKLWIVKLKRFRINRRQKNVLVPSYTKSRS